MSFGNGSEKKRRENSNRKPAKAKPSEKKGAYKPKGHFKKEPVAKKLKPPSYLAKVQVADIGDLKPNPRNPRNNEDAVGPVAESISKYGFVQPIMVGSDGLVIAGHTRLAAAKLLGMEKVPIVIVDHLTQQEQEELALADNKLAELSTWNYPLLYEWLSTFKKREVKKLPGFTVGEIEALLQANAAAGRPQAPSDEEETTQVVVTFAFTPSQYAAKKSAIEKAIKSLGVTPTIQEA